MMSRWVETALAAAGQDTPLGVGVDRRRPPCRAQTRARVMDLEILLAYAVKQNLRQLLALVRTEPTGHRSGTGSTPWPRQRITRGPPPRRHDRGLVASLGCRRADT